MSSSTLDSPRRSLELTPFSAARRRRRARVSPCLVGLSACLLVCCSALESSAQAAVAPPPSWPIERDIAGGEIHSYGLTLAQGQFTRAVFEQRGVDVVITLLDPEGRELQRVDNPSAGSGGAGPLSFEVERGGRYIVRVSPRNLSAPRGKYVFGVEL